MTLELNEMEQKTVAAALERYRIAKSAEKMLKGQKDTSLYAGYDVLLACVKTLQEKVA